MALVDRRHDAASPSTAKQVREPDDRRAVDMGPLASSIGYHMRRAQIAIFADIIKAFAEDDIRPAHYSVMVLIAANPGLNQSEIAAALGIKRTNFVALIDSLEQRGLARRSATQVDRRSYALYLTESGKALLGRLQAAQAEHEARVVARVGVDNRDLLLQMLGQVTTLAGDEAIEE